VLIIFVSIHQKQSISFSKFLAAEIYICVFEITTKITKQNRPNIQSKVLFPLS